MSVLRSLVFYLVFYTMSAVFSLATILALPLGERHFRKVPDAWSHFHRWCVRVILGIRVVAEGGQIEGAALYAFKHEAFFEAIDLATATATLVPITPTHQGLGSSTTISTTTTVVRSVVRE